MTDVSDARRILDLLAQGKITVDEADQLLRAVNQSASADAERAADAAAASSAPASTPKPPPTWLRMTVDKAGTDGRPGRQVKIRVPMALVRSGVKIGAAVRHLTPESVVRRLSEKGIDLADLSKLDLSDLEQAIGNLGDATIDVDDGRSRIRFSSE